MLPSIRHFFKLIDFDDTFDAHGFRIKVIESYQDGIIFLTLFRKVLHLGSTIPCLRRVRQALSVAI
jgi:hypothetical protein